MMIFSTSWMTSWSHDCFIKYGFTWWLAILIIDCELIFVITRMYLNYFSASKMLTWGQSMMTSSNGNIFRVTGPLCGELTGRGEFPTQRPMTGSFDVFFDLCLNKRLSKQSWGWWFETPSHPFWRHRNAAAYAVTLGRLQRWWSLVTLGCTRAPKGIGPMVHNERTH